ncbi:hypothetical protein RMSM_00051 [Rhodopirellula maiorica SM1]|uniref:Uncharacterized protein n=1 Tax=Rhodopirellula maiorica SM1 TaxID=1265738 RepID=M5SA15_9BACT|nr:hypothetical protein RMSM_00051 [Rhodopirellula maiorica SM1]
MIAGWGGDKWILGAVIAGWTFGSLGDTWNVIAGARECSRRLAFAEYEGARFLGQAKLLTNFPSEALNCNAVVQRISEGSAAAMQDGSKNDSALRNATLL